MKDQDFDSNARKLLLRRILEGSPDKSLSYSPDTSYAATKAGYAGPLTIQINEILAQHARLWAANMREHPPESAELGKVAWLAEMREADAQIKRFLAGTKLTTGAAA